jgi:hypothetical protein
MKHKLQLLAVWVLMVMLLISIGSCTTAKKATRYMYEHEDVAAKVCSVLFPVKDSIVVRDTTIFDSIYVEPSPYDTTIICDTLEVEKRVTIQCPPTKVIKETRYKDTTIYRTNTAKEAHLQALNDKAKETLLEAREQLVKGELLVKQLNADKNKWKLRFFILLAAFGAAIVLRIKRIL